MLVLQVGTGHSTHNSQFEHLYLLQLNMLAEDDLRVCVCVIAVLNIKAIGAMLHHQHALREAAPTWVATTSSEPSLLKSIATGGVRISTLPRRTPVIKSYAPTHD